MYSKSKNLAKGVLPKSFKSDKCKTSLRLAIARIKLMRNKKEIQVKQMRKELAQLLESGQERSAMIRVEHVIREEKTLSAYELIDIYCELIVARLPFIESTKNCPLDLKEAIASVIFASPRCADIVELADVKKQFLSKYGKEFVTAALEIRPECGVSNLVIEKLSARPPDFGTKIKILTSISEEHNVVWSPKSLDNELNQPKDHFQSVPQAFASISQVPKESSTVFSQTSDMKSSTPSMHYTHNDSRTSDVGQSGFQRGEASYGYVLERNVSSTKKSWNLEFKDAASAAQAAAESAEMASIAARAAVELASGGNHQSGSGDEVNGSFGIAKGSFGQGMVYKDNNLMESSSGGEEAHVSSIRSTDRTYDNYRKTERLSSGTLSSYDWHVEDSSGMTKEKGFSRENTLERSYKNSYNEYNEFVQDQTVDGYSKQLSSSSRKNMSRSSSNASTNSNRRIQETFGISQNFDFKQYERRGSSKEDSLEENYRGFKYEDGRESGSFSEFDSSLKDAAFDDRSSALWSSGFHEDDHGGTHFTTESHQETFEATSAAIFDDYDVDTEDQILVGGFVQGNLLNPVLEIQEKWSNFEDHESEPPLVKQKSSQLRATPLDHLETKFSESDVEENHPSPHVVDPPATFDDSDEFSSEDEYANKTPFDSQKNSFEGPHESPKMSSDVFGNQNFERRSLDQVWGRSDSRNSTGSRSSLREKTTSEEVEENLSFDESKNILGTKAKEGSLDKVWGRSDSGGSTRSNSSLIQGTASKTPQRLPSRTEAEVEEISAFVESKKTSGTSFLRRDNSGLNDSGNSPYEDDGVEVLNLGRLTGGLKNRGFPRPPYTKIPTLRDGTSSRHESIYSSAEEKIENQVTDIGEADLLLFDTKRRIEVSSPVAPRRNAALYGSNFREDTEVRKNLQFSELDSFKQRQHPKHAKESPSPSPAYDSKDLNDDAEEGKRPILGVAKTDNKLSRRTRNTNPDVERTKASNLIRQQSFSRTLESEPERKKQVEITAPQSNEESIKKASSGSSHVHPKLPDYDSFAAHFRSLRANQRP